MSQFLYLDQIQLELQQQQNALLSQEGERSRGHRLDTKDRTSTFPNLGFSFRHEERKPGTNVLCCKADNGKGKENVHYAQDILIPPSTKFAAFQFGKGDNSCWKAEQLIVSTVQTSSWRKHNGKAGEKWIRAWNISMTLLKNIMILHSVERIKSGVTGLWKFFFPQINSERGVTWQRQREALASIVFLICSIP